MRAGCVLLLLASAFALGQSTPPREPAPSPGQQQGAAEPKNAVRDADLVLVPVTITDPQNRLVTALERENFSLYEGNDQQEIRYFRSEDPPLSLGIILDTSGDMKGRIEKVSRATIEFLKTSNPKDEFFLITSSSRPELASGFTSLKDIQSRMLSVQPKGRRNILDAIHLAIEQMEVAHNRRKALLVISGWSGNQNYSEGEIRSAVKKADVQVYAIGLLDFDEASLGVSFFRSFTEVTGGRAFPIYDLNELADVATKIGIELRNQYVLGYKPTNPTLDGKWRKIKVKVLPPDGPLKQLPLHVNAKEGYYAVGLPSRADQAARGAALKTADEQHVEGQQQPHAEAQVAAAVQPKSQQVAIPVKDQAKPVANEVAPIIRVWDSCDKLQGVVISRAPLKTLTLNGVAVATRPLTEGVVEFEVERPPTPSKIPVLRFLATDSTGVTAELQLTGSSRNNHDPLDRSDILSALKAGIPERDLLSIVRRNGVSFGMDDTDEEKFRAAGASAELLLAIARSERSKPQRH